MYCVIRILSAFAACVLGAGGAAAANIEARQDLLPKLEKLQPVYGAHYERGTSYGDAKVRVVRLSGPIVPGDADALAPFVDQEKMQPPVVVVLDSDGGSLREGVRIGEVLRAAASVPDSGLWGVYVLDGDRCLSACALAFTMAAPAGVSRSSQSIRYIEQGARLGFHMGIIPENAAEVFAGETAAKVLNLSYDITAEIAKVVRSGISPVQLLEETLKYRTADAFFELRGGVRSLYMGFVPVSDGALSKPLNHDSLSTGNMDAICASVIARTRLGLDAWTQSDTYTESAPADWGKRDPVKVPEVLEKTGGAFMIAYMNGPVCHIRKDRQERLRISVDLPGNARVCGIGNSWCRDPSPPHGAVLTNAYLADAWGCSGGGFVTSFDGWIGDIDPSHKKINVPEPGTWKRTIERTVSLRSKPSIKGSRLTWAKKGMQVQVLGCRATDDPEGLWLQARIGEHKGWISARFVAPMDPFAMLRPSYAFVTGSR